MPCPLAPRDLVLRVFRVMLVLFCASATLQDANSIPPSEIVFYVFMGVSPNAMLTVFSAGFVSRC